MRERETGKGASEHPTGLLGSEVSVGGEKLAQRRTVDAIHDEVGAGFVLEVVVDPHDVRMREARQRDRLSPKASPELRLRCQCRRQNLQRHHFVQYFVFRQIDRAGRSSTEYSLQAEPATHCECGIT